MIDRSHRRKFGQNYLVDPIIILRIQELLNPQPSDNFFEIGPGQGALTEFLVNQASHLTAIEIDTDNIKTLEKKFNTKNFQVIHADIMQVDLKTILEEGHRIVGNLPYNIASQIILQLSTVGQCCKDLHFMVQKEMGDVMTASPRTKSWNKFAVKVQWFFDTEKILEVPPTAFDIKPKVDSVIVRLIPKSIDLSEEKRKKLFNLIDQSFHAKRKTIGNNLKSFEIDWSLLNIDQSMRAEELSLQEFEAILNHV